MLGLQRLLAILPLVSLTTSLAVGPRQADGSGSEIGPVSFPCYWRDHDHATCYARARLFNQEYTWWVCDVRVEGDYWYYSCSRQQNCINEPVRGTVCHFLCDNIELGVDQGLVARSSTLPVLGASIQRRNATPFDNNPINVINGGNPNDVCRYYMNGRPCC